MTTPTIDVAERYEATWNETDLGTDYPFIER